MKIHIPIKLRSALLACLALLPMPMATSLISGTLSIGAVSYVLTQDQAQAAELIYTGGGDIAIASGAAATDSVIFDFTTTWMNGTGNPSINAPVYIRQIGLPIGSTTGVVGADGTISGITEISNARSITFTNAVLDFDDYAGKDAYVKPAGATDAPTGDFLLNANTSAVNLTAFNLYFECEMKDYSGDIVSLGSGFYIRFGSLNGVADQTNRNLSASGTGEIKVGGRIVHYYLIGDDIKVNNSKITVSNTIDGREITANGGSELEALLHFSARSEDDTATYNVSSEIFADNYITATNATTNFTGVFESNTSQQFLGTASFANTTTLAGTTTITGSVAVQGTGSLTLAGLTTLGDDASLTATTDASINITGTWKSNKTLTLNAGTLSFGNNAIIDLSGMTAVGGVYTVFSGVTSASFGSLTAANILAPALAGYSFVFNENGTITATLDAVVHEYAGGSIDWDSTDTVFEAGGPDFVDNDYVDFLADSTVTLTSAVTSGRVRIMEGATVTLSNDNNVANTLTSSNIEVGGTLVLEGNVLTDTSLIVDLAGGTAGTVVFDLGAGVAADYENQIAGFTGDVSIRSGSLTFDSTDVSAGAAYDLFVEEGATLNITGVSFNAGGTSITLVGGDVSASGEPVDFTKTTTLNINTDLKNQLTATGFVTINTSALNIIRAGITGSGYIQKTGTAIMELLSSTTHTGTLDIVEGQVNYGNADGTNYTNTFENIIIRSGATLRFQNAATNFNSLQMDGGTFAAFDMNAGTAHINRMEVTADSTIQVTWNNQWSVGTLTGEADLSFTAVDGGQLMAFTAETVVDYNGDLNFNNNVGRYDLTLGTVIQGEGKSMNVTNFNKAVLATDFVMQGAGSLTLQGGMDAGSMHMQQSGSFTAAGVITDSFVQTGTGTTTLTSLSIRDNGTLHMAYNGTLNYTTLSLAANVNLRYGAGDSLLVLNNANFNTLESISLVLLDIDRTLLSAGYSLGISSEIDINLISVLGLTTDQYSIADDGTGIYKITINADAAFDLDGWDMNWGLDEVLKAPTTIVTAENLTGNTYLFDVAEYNADGKTSVILASGSGNVFGGNNTVNAAGHDTDVWIMVTGGTWDIIAGGNNASWINGGATPYNFIGDSHILVNQDAASSVEYILGGNHQDGQNSNFTGDVYISIYSDTLTGSIIGGPTTAHQDIPVQTGDTNIFIYTPLTKNTADSLGVNGFNLNDRIIGAGSWISNGSPATGAGAALIGNSNITVDLSATSVADATDFTKKLIGGSYSNNGWQINHNGDAYITITGTDNLTFNQVIVGGSYIDGGGTTTRTGDTHITITANGSTFDSANGVGIMGGVYHAGAGNSTITGNTHITINGENGTFEDRIAGAGEIVGGTATLTGTASVTINGGTYNNLVMGGFNQHNGTATSGVSIVTIESGTFTANVAGGGVHANGTHNRTGYSSLIINDGTFTSVYGGALGVGQAGAATPDVVNTTAGLSSVTINGGTVNNDVVGGSNIGVTFAGTLTAEGGASVEINAGIVKGSIIGGHQRTSGTAANTISMGDVLISLNGGEIQGNVYAAGFLGEALADSKKSTTASTKVVIDSDVVFTDGVSVSGGFGGDGAASGEVTGSRTLSFSGTGDYSNIANVTFESFNTIEVTEASSVVTFDKLAELDATLTKTGAGTLSIDSVSSNGKSFNVQEGTLKIAASSTLTAVSVAANATLDASTAGASINGNLSLFGGSTLTLGDNTSGLVIGAGGSLSFENTAASKIAINQSATSIGSSGLTLFSSLTDLTLIEGITFEQKAGRTVANASDYITMDGFNLDGYYLLYDEANDRLTLTNQLAQSLRWDTSLVAGTDNFSDMSWVGADGLATNFTENSSATFGDNAGAFDVTITVDGNYIASDFTVSDDYAFTRDAGTSSLSITGTLNVTAGVTDFDFAPTLNTVTVASGATLNFTGGAALSVDSLSNSGTFTTEGNLTIAQLVTNGGTVTAGNLILAAGDNTFAELTVTNTVTSTGLLTLGGDSSIATLAGGGSLSILDGGILGLTNDAALVSLTNKGTLNADGNLSLTNGAAEGGILSVGGNLTLSSVAGNNSTFSKLTVTGDVTSGTLLTVGDGSTIGGTLSGGGGGTLSGGGLVSSGTVSVGTVHTDGLASLTVTDGKLTITSTLTVDNEFSNSGILELYDGTTYYNLILRSATLNGGIVSAHNVTLAGDSSFEKLVAKGSVALNGQLTVSDGSDIATLVAGGTTDAFNATGDVTLGQVTGSLSSLSNDTGLLTLGSDLTVTGAFSNKGTLNMDDNNLEVGAAVTEGGILTAGNVTLTGENTFTSIAASGTITADALTVNADSSAAALSNDMALTVNNGATFTASNANNLELASLTGGNFIMTGANAALNLKGASSATSLQLASNTLTLGGALNVTNALTAKADSVLNLGIAYNPEKITPVISADSLVGSNGLSLQITEAALTNLGLDNNTDYTLIALSTALADGFGLAFDGGTDSITYGSYTYKLGLSTDKTEVLISVEISGNTWLGTGAWDSSNANWTDPAGEPSSQTPPGEAFFFDSDIATRDIVVSGEKTVKEMQIAAGTGKEYSFSGDSITTERLSVSSGTMNMENDIKVSAGTDYIGETVVSADAVLNVNGNAQLITNSLDVKLDGQVNIATGAGISVLSNSSIDSLNNEGNLSLGGTGQHNINELTGEGELLLNILSTATVTNLTQKAVSLGADSTLTITTEASISGAITNDGLIEASGATLNITENALNGGNVNAGMLNVTGAGATMGALTAGSITLSGALVDGADALLNTSSLNLLDGETTLNLKLDGLTSSTGIGSYNVIDFDSGLSWSDVTLDSSTADAITDLVGSGYDVIYNNDGGLGFTVEAATDRRWTVSNNFAVTPGLENADPNNKIEPIFNTLGTANNLSRYDILDSVKMVYVDVDFELNLTELTLQDTDTDGLIIRNLTGNKTLTLTGKGSSGAAADISKATLDNNSITKVSGLTLNDMRVDVTSADENSLLTVGTLTLNNSAFNVLDGGRVKADNLVQNGGTITIGSPDSPFSTFGNTPVAGGSLTVGDAEVNGDIFIRTDSEYIVEGTMTATANSSIDIDATGNADIEKLIVNEGITLDITGAGKADIADTTVEKDAQLNVGSTSNTQLGNVALGENSILSVEAGGSLTVDMLTGGASSQLQGDVSVAGGKYEGSYNGDVLITVRSGEETSLNMGGSLSVVGEADAKIKLVAGLGNSTMNSLNTNNSHVTLEGIVLGGDTTKEATQLTLTTSSSMTGGGLSMSLNNAALQGIINGTTPTLSLFTGESIAFDGVSITITQSDAAAGVLDLTGITQTTGIELIDLGDSVTNSTANLEGLAFGVYFTNERIVNGIVVVDLNTDLYSSVGLTQNGKAGIAMLNLAIFEVSPSASVKDNALAAVLSDMNKYLTAGSKTGADKLGAAAAGASVTALGSALAGDIGRQLASVRNRTMSMGASHYVQFEEVEYNGWISAESNQNYLNDDGTASGHDSNAWGGSIGVDANINQSLTIGAVFTAMYGEVNSDVADAINGELNTQYLTFFARSNVGRWSHSFIVTGGIADASTTRTINTTSGSYESTGDTSGYGLGMLYELGYNIALNEEQTTVWQPVVSLAFQHSSMDGYTEKGHNAALTVGEQTMSYATIAAGARLETVIGENAFNRAAVFSLRAMVKADMGDLASEADVKITEVSGASHTISGTERGILGLELGTGVSIPVMGDSGSIFIDASVELRDQQNNINASAGYSFSF